MDEIKAEVVNAPSRKLTARWTVETKEELKTIYSFSERSILLGAVTNIENERKKRESARSGQSQRNPTRF